MLPIRSTAPARATVVFLVLTGAALPAWADTFGELSASRAPNGAAQYGGYNAGPYASAPGGDCQPLCQGNGFSGGAEGTLPTDPGYGQPYISPLAANPRAYLPYGQRGDQPNDQMMLGSFGQINATTDPFNPWGLSTPYMFVPWSTPMSGWTNAQTWNWWRERSGALPRNW
ncbi:hypothetical protein [Rhodobacter ferrooxidans]|uniref:Uncharacterized protein n=1 Tax=Rhodobacter ferrooxidans TaxID=371731 RepID=C8S1C0_9RHOB|nr:hypothetical protein [Rhodobacter sp. SW2]EEW25318.1 hypothetical protein Rsw2DRAFT_1848 [Rhodobacter sp. SW2]